MVDKVHHPQHYGGDTKFEAIKVIDDWGLGGGFTIGSALKYLCRAPHKGTEEVDLRKALWYIRYAASKSYLRPEPSVLDPDSVATAWQLDGDIRHVLSLVSYGTFRDAGDVLEAYIVRRFG